MLWTSNTDLRNDLLSASSILKLCRILLIGAWQYISRLLMILTDERIIIYSQYAGIRVSGSVRYMSYS